MKQRYQTMLEMVQARLAQKKRGMDFFVEAMFRNILRAFDPDAHTVYVSGYAFPMELLWAFDVTPFDFEIACNNLPEVMFGSGSGLMLESEKRGYSRNICSFDRLIIGCLHQGMLPKGDLFLTSSYYCQGKAKTNEIVAEYHGMESVLLDVPNEINPAAVNYVVTQLQDIRTRLEKITGTKLDPLRLQQAIRHSNEARAVLLEIYEYLKRRPCPWNGVEACLLALGGAVFWGSPIRTEIHKLLLEQIQERVEKGKTIPEAHRILWFPWVPVQSTNIFNILKENRANVVMAEAAFVFWPELDEEQPFESLAMKALLDPHVGKAERRIQNLMQCLKDFEIDGAVHFATTSCYHENTAFPMIRDAIKQKGLPLLNLSGDMSDERNYSAAETAVRISAFLELLAG